MFFLFDNKNVNISMNFLDKNIEIQDYYINIFEIFENFDHKNLFYFKQNNILSSILIIHDSFILNSRKYS